MGGPSWSVGLVAAIAGARVEPPREASAAFFERGTVAELRLQVGAEELQKLREEPRAYVRAALFEDGKLATDSLGIKLKGAAGSFREVDDRPALTLKLDRFGGTASFHGLVKLHLNNSVQDESLLNEWVAAELLRAAGVPAARVAHARVWLNERDLGVYVVKEGFDQRFLARHFARAEGNLYDGGFCQDVDAELELDAGRGPAERADLKALAEACQDPDLVQRWKRLDERVDVAAFLRFAALETMLGHWDGYSLNSNNYRLYFEPGGKAHFLPHGLDQILGDAEASVLDPPTALVAASILKRPEWRAAYRKELRERLALFEPRALIRKLEPVQKRLRQALARHDEAAMRVQGERYLELCERIAARERSLKEQVRSPEPKPLQFKPGVPVVVRGWHARAETEDVRVEERRLGDPWFAIEAGASGRAVGSWRRRVLLPRGRYELEAALVTSKVEPLLEEGAPLAGAGVRISGSPATQGLDGSASQTARFAFEVTEEAADVELVLELRATKGSARFRAESLLLTRMQDR